MIELSILFLKTRQFIPRRWVCPRWSNIMVKVRGAGHLPSYLWHTQRKYPAALLSFPTLAIQLLNPIGKIKRFWVLKSYCILSCVGRHSCQIIDLLGVQQRMHSWKPLFTHVKCTVQWFWNSHIYVQPSLQLILKHFHHLKKRSPTL